MSWHIIMVTIIVVVIFIIFLTTTTRYRATVWHWTWFLPPRPATTFHRAITLARLLPPPPSSYPWWWWWWWWWCWWWWSPKLESNIEKSGLEWFWFCAAPSRPKLTRTIWIWMSSSDFPKMPSWHHSDTDVFIFGILWFCWEVEIVSRPCSEVQRENLYLSCKSSVVQLVPQFDRGAKSRLLSFSLAQK